MRLYSYNGKKSSQNKRKGDYPMKSSFFADLVTGISGFLFCLSLSIVLILHFRPLYVQEIKNQELSSLSSMSKAEILEQYDALIHYNSLFYRGELHFPSLPMSEEGPDPFPRGQNNF